VKRVVESVHESTGGLGTIAGAFGILPGQVFSPLCLAEQPLEPAAD